MKKYIAALSLIATLLTACDPSEVEEGTIGAGMTADQLEQAVTLTQTVEGQNKFTFGTNPATTVQLLDQDGSILATGTAGEIVGTPPLTAITVRTINQDGTIASFTREVTIRDYVDVPEIFRQLFGPEFTERTWVWDTTDAPAFWGNGGYMGDTGPNWWKFLDPASGNTVEAFTQQCVDKGYPDDTIEKGWMKFTLNGKKVETSRGETGTIAWDLSAKVKDGWDIGTITFTGTVPLLGIQPNSNNAPEYTYHILVSDNDHLHLCAGEPGAGEWGTAWFWNFKAKE